MAVRIWGGADVVIQLPVLVTLAAICGALPVWLLAAARGWRLKRRLARVEGTLAEQRGGRRATFAAERPMPQPRAEPLTIVPPAGA